VNIFKFQQMRMLGLMLKYGTSEGASAGWDTRGRGRKGKPEEEGVTANSEHVYHVTHSDKVPEIQEKGLLPIQTSNWVRAGDKERYGGGDIHVFEHLNDAMRWAAKMDWEFNKDMGSGKISVLRVKAGDKKWKIDENDPIAQAGASGRWLKRTGMIGKEDITGAKVFTSEDAKKLVGRHNFEWDKA
jgi:hypothetical protein